MLLAFLTNYLCGTMLSGSQRLESKRRSDARIRERLSDAAPSAGLAPVR
jgi:hypothetical protein